MDKGATFLQAQRERMLRKALLRAEGSREGRSSPWRRGGGGGRLRAEKTEVEEQDLGTRLHRQRPSFSMDSV